eukprot:1809439-Lingulodinium_polyedra.AAC.1
MNVACKVMAEEVAWSNVKDQILSLTSTWEVGKKLFAANLKGLMAGQIEELMQTHLDKLWVGEIIEG